MYANFAFVIEGPPGTNFTDYNIPLYPGAEFLGYPLAAPGIVYTITNHSFASMNGLLGASFVNDVVYPQGLGYCDANSFTLSFQESIGISVGNQFSLLHTYNWTILAPSEGYALITDSTGQLTASVP